MCALKFLPRILLPRPGSISFLPAVFSGILLLSLALQFLLPSQTTLPSRLNLMPRHQRIATIPLVGDYAVIKERPLFTPTRQFDEVVTTAAATAGVNGNFVVFGITIGRGLATAFIKNRDGTVAPIHKGDVHEGWLVQAIHNDGITFTHAGKRIDIPVGSHSEVAVQNPALTQATIAVQGRSDVPNPEAEQQAADSNPEEAQQ